MGQTLPNWAKKWENNSYWAKMGQTYSTGRKWAKFIQTGEKMGQTRPNT